jgi:hypothetical protein
VKLWEAILIAAGLRDLPLRDDETDYPPFGKRSRCPKCDSDGVGENRLGHSAAFVPARTELVGAFRISRPERMLRRCRNCGAAWFELPFDVSKAAD